VPPAGRHSSQCRPAGDTYQLFAMLILLGETEPETESILLQCEKHRHNVSNRRRKNHHAGALALPPDRATEPRSGVAPLPVSSCARHLEGLRTLFDRQPGEKMQLDDFRCLGVFRS